MFKYFRYYAGWCDWSMIIFISEVPRFVLNYMNNHRINNRLWHVIVFKHRSKTDRYKKAQ